MVSQMEVRFLSLAKCHPRANFDTSLDRFAKNFNFGPILGSKGPKKDPFGLKRAQNGAKIENFC